MTLWVDENTGVLVGSPCWPGKGYVRRGGAPKPREESPPANEGVEAVPTTAVAEVAAAALVELPSARATVKEWVTFMAEKGIEHPADATKAEMRVIAENHFRG